jgi:N-acetyl-anhydromuramyl-L-alanine amidase AmpD
MVLIDPTWMPKAKMRRIICHWTAGAHKASDHDRAYYHILIEDDGRLVRGTHSIKNNERILNKNYAAHTRNANGGAIGLSLCCMGGASESPFKPGPFPLTRKQWETLAQVAAELCQFYNIPVTPRTVLGHGEVETYLGISQKGKWDPMVLPWNPTMSKTQVGNYLRTLVQNVIEGGLEEEEEEPATITVVVRGKVFQEAALTNEASYVKIRPVAEAFQWELPHVGEEELELQFDDQTITMPYIRIQKSGYVACRDLAKAIGASIAWNNDTRTVTLT